eukprot:CAMPEP_0115188564 /NCGR_PEP_ID=MMETSP0270-20121206/11076_1 /TAXON_ID=71861 /ORGANISM="Scrippsiella trochoidea, Strain CCMP3099" /LENGTH=564 /DNA_ID=CAMNT_0002601751 /DNA_START=66 /DNA_END=1760 /DNA_ORIENTATION=+
MEEERSNDIPSIQECSFVLCDANSQGFPIRHASPGFQDLFMYSSEECFGQKCGELVGSQSVVNHSLVAAAELSGLAEAEAEAALHIVAGHASGEIRAMAANPSDRVAFTIVVNRTKSGSLVPCEVDMRILRHPVLGWSYCVGLQRGISGKISAASVLHAAAQGVEAFGTFVDSHRGKDQAARKVLSCGASTQYLHSIAAKMWQDTVSATMLNSRSKQKQSTTRSLASRSTASGGTSVSGFSVASARSSSDGAGACRVPSVVAEEGDSTMLHDVIEITPVQDFTERFVDLLEAVEGQEDEFEEQPRQSRAHSRIGRIAFHSAPAALDIPKPMQPSLGNAKLKQVVDRVSRKELMDLDFPLVLADPSLQHCPLVLCSAGFSSLTGYQWQETLGRDLRFLFYDVPQDSVCRRASLEMERLCSAAAAGDYYPGGGSRGLALFRGLAGDQERQRMLSGPEDILPEGELAYVHDIAAKTGRCVRCMFHLKQVELDDDMFVLCLQMKVPDPKDNPEEHDRYEVAENVEQRCRLAFARLAQNMDVAMQVLAAQFWISAAMRRQTACGDSDGE